MDAIVCNTMTGAVSEYTRYGFQSITPRYGGSASGLYLLEGDSDDGLRIVAELRLPATLRESTLKTHIGMVYLSMQGTGSAQFIVAGRVQEWQYEFPLRDSGQTRCKPGAGIRENYLGFGLRTPAGQAFTLDRIEVVDLASKTRRV